ncbi:MAG TPA: antibiotic biosynthesis monooxygenase family protein [Steroidobacteraceae bacterium]|jgi:heme-degrading monooxygenase HmoA
MAGETQAVGENTVWEIAQIEIKSGAEAAFEAAAAKALPLFQRARGCRKVQFQRSVENPGRYWLIAQWDTLEDHTVHFRGSADFQEWRKLVGEHFAAPPVVEHVRRLPIGFG